LTSNFIGFEGVLSHNVVDLHFNTFQLFVISHQILRAGLPNPAADASGDAGTFWYVRQWRKGSNYQGHEYFVWVQQTGII